VGQSNTPEVNTLIELAVFGGEAYASRVEDRQGERITVAAPLDLKISDLPQVGREVILKWPVGGRGRCSATGQIIEVNRGHVATWEVKVTGQFRIEQARRFVRGGGGEPVRMRRTLTDEDPTVEGRVIDLSERSVRCRVSGLEIKAGDPVDSWITLDDDVIEISGSVLRVVDKPDDKAHGIVVVFEPGEAQATAIRRYVLRRQLLARARDARG
jgi:hypothetical protein